MHGDLASLCLASEVMKSFVGIVFVFSSIHLFLWRDSTTCITVHSLWVAGTHVLLVVDWGIANTSTAHWLWRRDFFNLNIFSGV